MDLPPHVVRASIWFAAALGIAGIGAVLILSPVPSWLVAAGWVMLFIGTMSLGISACIFYSPAPLVVGPVVPAETTRDESTAAKPQLAPNIIPTLPRIMQAYKDAEGFIRLGVDRTQTHLPFEQRRNSGHVILAPFKNEPDADHPKVRTARALGASVKLKAVNDFLATGLWFGALGRLIELAAGAPEQSIVLAFVGADYAQLVRDQRGGLEQRIDYQIFWTRADQATVPETTIVVKLMNGDALMGEFEYLLRLNSLLPVVYLLTPSKLHTSASEPQSTL